jgi:predicted DNA binding CopG/RHH family protein
LTFAPATGARGIPYQRLIREALEQLVQDARPT